MSTVCKTCGAMSRPGAVKCMYCGGTEFGERTPLRTKPRPQAGHSAQSPKCSSGIFNIDGWREQWEQHRRSYTKLGLILTNTAMLSDPAPFREALENYIRVKDAAGVHYCVLDIRDQRVIPLYSPNCRDLLNLLYAIYTVAIPDYLFLIGDAGILPGVEWDNEGDDADDTVLSDLPFITFDLDSPWSGKIFDFSRATPVGRLPTSPDTGFSEAIHYLNFTAGRRGVDPINTYVLTAKCWEETSHSIFDRFNPLFLTSPYITCRPPYLGKPGYEALMPVDPRYNLLGFNLHGGEGVSYWGGQYGPQRPIAFHPSYFPVQSPNGYVVCVEACYGANPFIEYDDDEPSALVFAMANRCLAFVGSTRVAWGHADGSMDFADTIAQVFCREVSCGKEFGEAFLSSLTAICNPSCEIGGVHIKTLAEFNLYGDPSGVLTDHAAHHRGYSQNRILSISRPVSDSSRAFKLLDCDNLQKGCGTSSFSADERAKMTLMAQRVAQTGKSYLQAHYPAMAQVQPKVFKIAGRDAYQSFYTQVEGDFISRVSLITDGNGTVIQTLMSK